MSAGISDFSLTSTIDKKNLRKLARAAPAHWIGLTAQLRICLRVQNHTLKRPPILRQTKVRNCTLILSLDALRSCDKQTVALHDESGRNCRREASEHNTQRKRYQTPPRHIYPTKYTLTRDLDRIRGSSSPLHRQNNDVRTNQPPAKDSCSEHEVFLQLGFPSWKKWNSGGERELREKEPTQRCKASGRQSARTTGCSTLQ